MARRFEAALARFGRESSTASGGVRGAREPFVAPEAPGAPGPAEALGTSSAPVAGPVSGASDVPAVCERGIVPGNLVVLLPFALADAFDVPDAAEVASRLAEANAFGAAHFLAQDRLLDGDDTPTPAAAHFSDLTFERFVRGYAEFFPAQSPLWVHLDAYLDEYFDSLEWERRVLRTPAGRDAVAPEALGHSLLMLGRRMSALKVTAAAVSIMSGRTDIVPACERMVESFHESYQLMDDLADLAGDLAAGRPSFVAWLISDRAGCEWSEWRDSNDALATAASGALEEVIVLVEGGYAEAYRCAEELGVGALVGYFGECSHRAVTALGRLSRRSALTGGTRERTACSVLARDGSSGAPTSGDASMSAAGFAASDGSLDVSVSSPGSACGARVASGRRPHAFTVHGVHMIYDPGSGLLFKADGAALDALKWLDSGSPDAGLRVLRMNHGDRAVDEALAEVEPLRQSCAVHSRHDREGRFEPRHAHVCLSGLTALSLHVSGDCNLRCDYCYLEGVQRTGPRPSSVRVMSEQTAMRALDVLFDESVGERDLSLVFFGGEPLMNIELIESVGRAALARAEAECRRLTLHITTNGTLLKGHALSTLRELGVRVMVSIDGDRDTHDAHRKTRNGGGTHDVIAANVAGLPDDMVATARATLTEDTMPLVALVSHLSDLGFGAVHLAPVSGLPLRGSFVNRLENELTALAADELRTLTEGGRPRVGNFAEAVLSLELSRHRERPCGAGSRYVSVAHDGGLYLCHRLVDRSACRVGDVAGGLDRVAVADVLAAMGESSVGCLDCWAFGLCGGPCFHDRGVVPDERCRFTRKVLELSMWLYSSLPAERRKRLRKVAGRLVEPTAWGRG